jgi:carboxylesterase type B
MRSLITALLIAGLAGCAGPGPVRSLDDPIATDKGLVSGTGGDVRSFKGIPYAKAPIGELRWRAPQAAEPWTNVRDGSRFGPDCMQPAEYPELRGAGMSEDCLSVNVWSPARTSAERLPVMVWIYGGGFTYGSGSHPTYDGEALAKRGIVVVTLNYRVGLFGFMAHPQLTAESPDKASGNYALMDQIAALQWVQRNIAAFGGDPKKVTVAGQSAGAMAISALMTSDGARGLFQQAILQSVGVMRPRSTLKEAEAFGLQAGASIAELRRMDAPALVQRLKDIAPGDREVTSARGLHVIVDGSVVKQEDWRAYPRGDHMRIPMIVGATTNEGGGIARNHPVKTTAQFKDFLGRNFRGLESQATQAYAADSDALVLPVLSDLVSDTQFLYGTREMLRTTAAQGIPVYRYVFSQKRNGSATEPIHGDELQYPFENLGALHRNRVRPSDPSDAKIAKEMADAWARFVKTGNPNGGTLPNWPTYSASNEQYLEFGKEIRSGVLGPSPRLDLIRDHYARQRSAEQVAR